MTRPFREEHLFKIFFYYESETGPLDNFLRQYFRAHKAVGSKDRRYLAETVYSLVRWQGLLDYLSQKPASWAGRFALYKNFNPLDYLADEKIPMHIRVSFPRSFFQMIAESYGAEQALQICLSSNTEAPTTIRANTLKTTREQLLDSWSGVYEISACTSSNQGLIFHRKTNFFAMPEFKAGLFEVQDEGSQIIADLIEAKPGQQVLDFCAGSGGKTLAFAPKMQHKGQIYLHDIRLRALLEAKKRLKRAGIQNAQFLNFDDPNKNLLKNRMDWILVDAPCSGSGTLRRNPDMKWKFNQPDIDRLIEDQRSIFEQALDFMRPDGKIVYATCSLFAQENEQQVAFFQEKFKLKLVKEPFKSLPSKGGMDGFFGAIFSRI